MNLNLKTEFEARLKDSGFAKNLLEMTVQELTVKSFFNLLDFFFGQYSVSEHLDQKNQKRSIAKIVFSNRRLNLFQK